MFETLFTQPLYNGFIYLVGVMPGGDVGFAIIVLTLIVRILFYPVFASQIRTTMGMQAMQGELEEVKERHKNDKTEQARQVMELYKKYKVNPFSLILSLIIQIPVLLALYFAFFHTKLPEINSALLYPLVHTPGAINVHFLGLVDLTLAHNIFVVAIVAALQYLVIKLTLSRTNKSTPANLAPEKLQMQQMQQKIMQYFMPALIAVVTYSTPAAVGLYFAAGSIISIGQEWLIRRQLAAKPSR